MDFFYFLLIVSAIGAIIGVINTTNNSNNTNSQPYTAQLPEKKYLSQSMADAIFHNTIKVHLEELSVSGLRGLKRDSEHIADLKEYLRNERIINNIEVVSDEEFSKITGFPLPANTYEEDYEDDYEDDVFDSDDDIDYNKLFWGGWSREIHYIKQQRDISEKMFDINPDSAEVDEYAETAEIGRFDVSLSSCTCKTFQKRRLPCKHIYYLAWELGLPFPANPGNNPSINFDKFDSWINENINTLDLERPINIFDDAEYCGNEYWGDWSPAIHKLSPQIERQSRQSLNPAYQTSLYSCTCPDFVKRRLPCKHIYAVASQNSVPF